MRMSEFCLIEAEDSTHQFRSASTKLNNNGNILPEEFGRVGTPMRRRLPASEILSRNMKEAGGISVPEIVRRAAAKGYQISRNTVNYILNGSTKNPGLFTIEAIAVALEKAPEQLAAEFLGIRADDSNFKGSQFAMLYEFYRGLQPAQRLKADSHIEGLMAILQHVKSQT